MGRCTGQICFARNSTRVHPDLETPVLAHAADELAWCLVRWLPSDLMRLKRNKVDFALKEGSQGTMHSSPPLASETGTASALSALLSSAAGLDPAIECLTAIEASELHACCTALAEKLQRHLTLLAAHSYLDALPPDVVRCEPHVLD